MVEACLAGVKDLGLNPEKHGKTNNKLYTM